jgi:hypothetical protein
MEGEKDIEREKNIYIERERERERERKRGRESEGGERQKDKKLESKWERKREQDREMGHRPRKEKNPLNSSHMDVHSAHPSIGQNIFFWGVRTYGWMDGTNIHIWWDERASPPSDLGGAPSGTCSHLKTFDGQAFFIRCITINQELQYANEILNT